MMSTQTGKETTTFSLPEEILADILPRVSSVESLLRFKCLSKWWCSFISTKKFAKTHLECTSKNALLDHQRVIIISKSKNGYMIDNYPVGWFWKKSTHRVVQFEFDYAKTGSDLGIVGFCNGLCCILVDDSFVLWNPYTRKSHVLPPRYDKSDFNFLSVRGFGYDASNDDYKVFVFLKTRQTRYGEVANIFRLYSLRTNSWKTVDGCLGLSLLEHAKDFVGPFPHNGVFVNGKLHWGVDPKIGFKIVAFDVGSEACELVEEPSLANDGRLYLELGVLRGCLCVLRDTEVGSVDVWIMKNYGVRESWCRLVSVPYIPNCCYFPHIMFSPLCMSEKGEVLVYQIHSLFIYNPVRNSLSSAGMKNWTGRNDIGVYVPSLVSPFPDSEMERN